jgi:cell wall-associated NlpC family hydrolase
VTGTQKRALDAYRSVLAEQASQLQQISSAQRDAAVNLQQLVTDRSAAAQADSARKQALTQVSGELAVLVAQVQAAQQAAARAAIVARSPSTNTPATTPPLTVTAPTARRPNPNNPPSSTATTKAPSAPASPGSRLQPTTTVDPAGGSSQQNGGQPSGGVSPQAPGASKALSYARAQLGKPYQWGGAGPDSFDCSGLTMMAWQQAGVYFPHLAQDQYDMTQRISISQALPGDLIFFGTPSNVFHVGIYVGNGQMIDAPETGETVSVQSIYWSDLLGAGRVTG